MKIRLIAILLVLFGLTISIHGQEISFNIPGNEAYALSKSLTKRLADTSRIDLLLRLAEFHLFKDGEHKANIDSAIFLARDASVLNAKLQNHNRNGHVLLVQAIMARKARDTIEAKQRLVKAIASLRNEKQNFHLAMAFVENLHYFNLKQPEAIRNFFDTINRISLQLQQIKQTDLQEYTAKAMMNFYQKNLWNTGDSIKLAFLNRFLSLSIKLKNKQGEFWARKDIADTHFQQGKVAIALDELQILLQEQHAGDFTGICFTTDLLAGIHIYNSNYDKALLYSLETIKNVRTHLDSFYLCNFYNRISNCYSMLSKDHEALTWSMKAYQTKVSTGEVAWIFDTCDRIISLLISTGQQRKALTFILENHRKYIPDGIYEEKSMMKGLGRAYAAVGENHQAEKYLLKYVELAEKRDLSQSFSGSDYTTYYFIATFYFKIGQFDKAEKYFNTALVKWHKGSLSVQDLYKSNFLFKLDSVRGNYVSAIRHLQTSQSIKDSIFTATKSKQIENLKITYETEQKDSLLKLNAQNINLLTKQGELQKSKLEQATVLRNITFIAATLLFVVMLLLVTGYRNKQKSNMKLRLQQAEIKDQNKTLQHLVNEKDWLVKEIHHRVKNNMQIVMSLLNSQSAYIESESALSAIHDSQHRVYAMSLIHQKLYGSGNLSSIDMSVYIRELGSYLADSFNTGQRIRFEYQIEPLELDVSQAVPLGLILNEAITNSIKYAFPNQISGNIFISLSPVTQYQYILSISDNGIGMPSQPGGRRRGSLGMSLMAGLSEDLNGNFSFNGENGTTINVSFLLDRRINEFTTVSSSLLSSN